MARVGGIKILNGVARNGGASRIGGIKILNGMTRNGGGTETGRPNTFGKCGYATNFLVTLVNMAETLADSPTA